MLSTENDKYVRASLLLTAEFSHWNQDITRYSVTKKQQRHSKIHSIGGKGATNKTCMYIPSLQSLSTLTSPCWVRQGIKNNYNLKTCPCWEKYQKQASSSILWAASVGNYFKAQVMKYANVHSKMFASTWPHMWGCWPGASHKCNGCGEKTTQQKERLCFNWRKHR